MLSSFWLAVTAFANEQTFLGVDEATFKETASSKSNATSGSPTIRGCMEFMDFMKGERFEHVGVRALTKNYRRLALIYHPDKNPEAHDKFTRLVGCYDALIELKEDRDVEGCVYDDEPRTDRIKAVLRWQFVGKELDGVKLKCPISVPMVEVVSEGGAKAYYSSYMGTYMQVESDGSLWKHLESIDTFIGSVGDGDAKVWLIGEDPRENVGNVVCEGISLTECKDWHYPNPNGGDEDYWVPDETMRVIPVIPAAAKQHHLPNPEPTSGSSKNLMIEGSGGNNNSQGSNVSGSQSARNLFLKYEGSSLKMTSS